jgi:thioredoxin 1
MAEGIKDVTDSTFEQEVLRSDLPVLVDFWAVWCVPCKAIAPALEQIVAAHEEKLRVVKLNVEDNPGVPGRYGVRSVPTLLLFKGGDVKETLVGAMSRDRIMAALGKHL